MKKIGILIFIGWINFTFSQDLDIYKKTDNSNYKIPDISKEMTYEEFKILGTNLRMQDMMIATILPGHVHFKIGEKKTGYYILGTRVLGYGAWAYLALNNKSLFNIVLYDNYTFWDKTSTGDKIVAYTSVVLMVGSYFYDWIHGKYILDDKQSKIRYKYAKKKAKLSFGSINFNNKYYPALSFSYTFQ